jgi:hypothetical protein
MECVKLTHVISAVLDEVGTDNERRELAWHARACRVCSSVLAENRRLRMTLGQLPRKMPSEHLQTQLQVTASRECARTVTRLNFVNQYAAWQSRIRLTVKNLMQPFALPVAGGLVSALFLFALLLPVYSTGGRYVDNDVPTVLFTEASVKEAYPPALGAEVVVDLTVDDQGRLIDYTIIKGGALVGDEFLRRQFETALLLAQFNPATAFGQPKSGKIRVSFRSSSIDVRG